MKCSAIKVTPLSVKKSSFIYAYTSRQLKYALYCVGIYVDAVK